MKFKDIPDMERYLQEDCYCPGEIYDTSGFFYQIYEPDSYCTLVEEFDNKMVILAQPWNFKNSTDDVSSNVQAILIWTDDPDYPGKIIECVRVDATENNISILKDIIHGKKPDGRKIDEFNPGSINNNMKKILDISDIIMIN